MGQQSPLVQKQTKRNFLVGVRSGRCAMCINESELCFLVEYVHKPVCSAVGGGV